MRWIRVRVPGAVRCGARSDYLAGMLLIATYRVVRDRKPERILVRGTIVGRKRMGGGGVIEADRARTGSGLLFIHTAVINPDDGH